VSAFPHAPEARDDVFMWPPKEWVSDSDVIMVWWEQTALYGRQTAGADFRDYFEVCVTQVGSPALRRGVREPTLHKEIDGGVVLTHHIDDVRVVGNPVSVAKLIQGLMEFLLLKVSGPIAVGDSHEYLHRVKTRTELGWITIADPKHLENVFESVGYTADHAPGKQVTTPGTKRQQEEENPLDPVAAGHFRSGAGSAIHLAADMEEVSFAAKECARKIHTPTDVGDLDLRRLARYLFDKQDWVTDNRMTKECVAAYRADRTVVLKAVVDSDWASSREDRKSTSGARFTIGGFRVHHTCAY
jgi:hypothetical protein